MYTLDVVGGLYVRFVFRSTESAMKLAHEYAEGYGCSDVRWEQDSEDWVGYQGGFVRYIIRKVEVFDD